MLSDEERKELIERIKELEQENREIREWKYVIDNPIDLEKLKELDLIKIKGKEYISKDKIKAKLEKIIQILEAKPYTAYTLYGDILHESDEIADMLKEVLEKE